MASRQLKHAIGIFSNRQDARQALIELKRLGFPIHKISVLVKTPDDDHVHDSDTQEIHQLPITRVEGAKAGAIAGSATGGLLTLITGLSILLVPGVGPALAVESVLTTFLGSGAVAAASGLCGALRGWFIPEEQAKIYTDRFNRGDYLVTMEVTKEEIQMAEPILKVWGIWAWRVYDAP